jgi:hypothetical protein
MHPSSITVEDVAVNDEARELIPVNDGLALNVTRALYDERLDPPCCEKAQGHVPVGTWGFD